MRFYSQWWNIFTGLTAGMSRKVHAGLPSGGPLPSFAEFDFSKQADMQKQYRETGLVRANRNLAEATGKCCNGREKSLVLRNVSAAIEE